MANTFRVYSPFKVIAERFEQAKSELERRREESAELIGVQLLSLAQKDYRTLSRGGAAADGRTWRALSPETVARKTRRKRGSKKTHTKSGKELPGLNSTVIGIDTGLQVASASPGFSASDGKGGNVFQISGWEVKVGYGRTYSKYFDMLRKLLPDKLPPVWRKALSSTFGKWLEKFVSKAAKGK